MQSILYDCQCAIFLIDITQKDNIKLFERLMENLIICELPYLKIIITENKIDSNREISEENITAFMNKYDIKDNIKISIKENTGIKELAKKVKNYVEYLETNIPNNLSCQSIQEFNSDNKLSDTQKSTKIINIIFLGNSMVGKTSLFSRLNKNSFNESFLSTIGIEKQIKTFKYKDKIYRINLCDTAGQDRYRTLPKKYYQNADGIFLLFDITNRESFNDISVWMSEVDNNIGISKKNSKALIIYLIGNKLDKFERVVSREDAEDLASFYKIKYFEISCKLNINIQEIYARMVGECIPNLSDNKEQSTFQVKVTKKKKRSLNESLCC